MILSVAELRQYIESDETNQALEARLQALELLVRGYTNNNFQLRAIRAVAVAVSANNTLMLNTPIPFRVGDTLQITDSDLLPDKLVTITAIADGVITVAEDLYDEGGVVITKVQYPVDVKMGVVNLLKWEMNNRDKVGIASETISRHSVTYVDMNGDNSTVGYPKALMGFLKPYKKARFGQGLSV